uniref:Amino acid transporter n=1 Tax=Plectus sambesii TaxID=2011161 RepID=A0A914WKV3_9BILA
MRSSVALSLIALLGITLARDDSLYFDRSVPEFETELNDDDFKRARLVAQDSTSLNDMILDTESMYSGDLFEGDIANPHLNSTTIESFITGAGIDNGLLANAIRNRYQLWQNNKVPYAISSQYSSYSRSLIASSMDDYAKMTCLQFVPKTNADTNYVYIIPDQGCYSMVGKTGGRQTVSLGSGCVQKGIIIHELMHAVGFFHEQSRTDREDARAARVDVVNRSMPERRRCFGLSSDNILLLLTVLGVITGISLGVTLWNPDGGWSKRELIYLAFPGELFVRMLKMLILPLIISSIVSSLACLDSSTAGKLGTVALIYYLTTTGIAVVIGIILAQTIQPGKWTANIVSDSIVAPQAPCISTAIDTMLDLTRSLFPENLLEATFRSTKFCMRFKNGTGNETVILKADVVMQMDIEERAKLQEIPEKITSDGMNILGLVMFAVVLGIVLGRMEEEGRPLKDFFKALEGACMRLISIVIWFSPIGITFLIAAQIVSMAEPGKELQRLMGYMITVLLGLFIHGVIVLPLIMLVLARRNPITFVYGMAQALVTALATSSSSATLPLSIKCVEENNGVDSRVARFVLPLGATINMDGTALYEAVAALYIAQTVGKEMTLGAVILVSLTATLASIGAAGIPQAGIVTMIMVLIAVGLDPSLFILIFPVDFFLDRIRTTVNVHGDAIGAAVVAKLCASYLTEAPQPDNELVGGYQALPQASPDPSHKPTYANNEF